MGDVRRSSCSCATHSNPGKEPTSSWGRLGCFCNSSSCRIGSVTATVIMYVWQRQRQAMSSAQIMEVLAGWPCIPVAASMRDHAHIMAGLALGWPCIPAAASMRDHAHIMAGLALGWPCIPAAASMRDHAICTAVCGARYTRALTVLECRAGDSLF